MSFLGWIRECVVRKGVVKRADANVNVDIRERGGQKERDLKVRMLNYSNSVSQSVE